MSVEKGYKHWHEDIQANDSPLEAGLGFTCDFSKEFRGKEVLLQQKAEGLKKRLICLSTDENDFLWNLEPIYRDGVACGFLRRTHFGFSAGRHIGYGYIESEKLGGQELTMKFLKAGTYEIEIGGQKRVPATFHPKCVFDPKGLRVQGDYGEEVASAGEVGATDKNKQAANASA